MPTSRLFYNSLTKLSSSPAHRQRRLHHRHSKKTYLDEYISNAARKLAKLILRASITTSAVLVIQLLYVVWRTPRLPPPPLSGVDFVRDGRIVAPNHDGELVDDNFVNKEKKQKEFRIALIGDSPVEGIGNTHHHLALSGSTAKAFAQTVTTNDEGDCYDCVRYWSYGKSGLTAREIQEEMVPYLHHVQDSLLQDDDDDDSDGKHTMIHAIVLLCGVNNVLDMNSTSSSFYSDVHSLIQSIRNNPHLSSTPLIVLGLPDFSKLPFLPWPLAFVLGYRGRMMQRMLEKAVREVQLKERESSANNDGTVRTVLKVIPDVQTVLESIGYHRCDGDDVTLKMKLIHPLLKYLGGIQLAQDRIAALGMTDFLCDDGFHPGRLGTVYVGNLIREAYEELMTQ
mmetsp:Transcript_9118/g.15496  ORF Transcript_9118/g.15496 Transcript_9118/m.15496 type:complete len:396 (-) Transcript_9118:27-1214(-)